MYVIVQGIAWLLHKHDTMGSNFPLAHLHIYACKNGRVGRLAEMIWMKWFVTGA